MLPSRLGDLSSNAVGQWGRQRQAPSFPREFLIDSLPCPTAPLRLERSVADTALAVRDIPLIL